MAAPDELDPKSSDRPAQAEPPVVRRPLPDTTEDDVEGHLYSAGPSTQGELQPRVPDNNPHGDR